MREFQPLAGVAQLRQRRPVEAAVALLFCGVVVEEGAVALHRGSIGQLGPELHPDAFRAQMAVPAGIGRCGGALVVAPDRLLPVDGAAERQKHAFHLAEGFVHHVVDPRLRLPGSEHADDAVVVVVEVDALADAVGAAEQLVVELAVDDDDIAARLVFVRAPGPAVFERHLEHGKEVGIGGAPRDLERPQLRIGRRQDEAGGVHRGLTRRRVCLHQRLGIGVAEHVRRLAVLVAMVRSEVVDLRHEQQ